jgi:hypothetical protein
LHSDNEFVTKRWKFGALQLRIGLAKVKKRKNMLSLHQAHSRLFWFRWGGRALFVISGVLMLFGLLKAIYVAAEQAPTTMERSILAVPARLITLFYSWLESFIPWVVAPLWRMSPDLNLRGPGLDNSGGFFAAYLVFLLGGYFLGQANRIAIRIAQTMQRVEEMMWEASLQAQLRAGATQEEARAQLNVNISLAGQDPPWYQRPWGLILFGIALPMAVEVLKVIVGLAKLP